MHAGRVDRKAGKASLGKLVEGFGHHIEHFKSKEYNEQEVRLNFIDPFWRCLGWPVGEQGHLPPHKVDVRIEREAVGLRPDYQFQPGGQVRFFCEAKKPAEDLTKRSHIFQAKSYAWSYRKKEVFAPFVILTDFEEFRFFRATKKPDFDRPNDGLIKKLDLAFDSYVDRFDDLWDTFSLDAVSSGSLDRYLDYDATNLQPLDEEFLTDLLVWRKLLAESILLATKDIETHELNEATQRVLDRIIFVRMLADIGAESRATLPRLAAAENPFLEVVALSKKLAKDYNGQIFKPHFSDDLTVNGEAVRKILKALDPERSPYRFSAIPVELLGRVYEAFLGHRIEIAKNRLSCKVEKKPDRLQAGGIYYTPEHVVDYIVRSVLAPLVKGKTPEQLKGLRVLDPASGSGSFLIGAFEYLLEYHLDWYEQHKNQVTKKGSKYRSDVDLSADGHLSVSLRKRADILRDNIFGVDIDGTAVEVAALSLYLKLLDGAVGTTKQLVLFAHGTILPDLSGNLKCGNSLVDIDTKRLTPLSPEEERRINPFSWADEFGTDHDTGRFDAVIGNPPYIKEYKNKQIFEDVRLTSLQKYCTGKMDIWYVFSCLALDLLRPGGRHAFITQNNWITSQSAEILRAKFRREAKILDLFDFHDYRVFRNANIQTMVYSVEKVAQSKPYLTRYRKLENNEIPERELERLLLSDSPSESVSEVEARVDPTQGSAVFSFGSSDVEDVLERIATAGSFRIEKSEVGQGIIGGPDDAFLYDPEESFTDAERPFLHQHYTTAERFGPGASNKLIAYLTKANIDELTEKRFPNFCEHMKPYRDALRNRRECISGQIEWFHLHWPRAERLFAKGPKIACPTRVRFPSFYYTEEEYYASRAVNMLVSDRFDLRWLNGVLNSSVVHFWLLKRGKHLGSMLQIDTGFLLGVPLPLPNSNGGTGTAIDRRIVALAETELRRRKEMLSARSTADQSRVERAITLTSRDLNSAVYEAYGLSKSDIDLIERELEAVAGNE